MYYVDSNCICCGVCSVYAPQNLKVDFETKKGYICKQPENEEEREQLDYALKECPVQAIREKNQS